MDNGKIYRVLCIYTKLMGGYLVTKAEEAQNHGLLILFRYAAGYQLFKDFRHFLLSQSSAFEKYFADSQNLSVGQLKLVNPLQTISLVSVIVYHRIYDARIFYIRIHEISDIVNVSLNCPLVHTMVLCFFGLKIKRW